MNTLKLFSAIILLCVTPSYGDHEPSTASSAAGQKIVRPQAPAKKEEAPELQCVPEGTRAQITVVATGRKIGGVMDANDCNKALAASRSNTVCAWTPKPSDGDRMGGTGWRPINYKTGLALGRCPIDSFDMCLKITAAASGGSICHNTCVGWKSGSATTGEWCGSSTRLDYCLEATRHGNNGYACSYPGEGNGSGPHWVVTKVDTCDYNSGHMALSTCNRSIPGAKK